MTEIRLTVRCESDLNHAKVLKAIMGPEADLDEVTKRMREIGAVLDGSSLMYCHTPGGRSPIGFCGLCRGALKSVVQEIEI